MHPGHQNLEICPLLFPWLANIFNEPLVLVYFLRFNSHFTAKYVSWLQRDSNSDRQRHARWLQDHNLGPLIVKHLCTLIKSATRSHLRVSKLFFPSSCFRFRQTGGIISTPAHLAALRHHGNYAKPAPPMRKNATTTSSGASSGQLDASFPPPPPPISCSSEPELTGSNSTTPRGSMENLPPPPPHLLHSDEDEPHQLRDASPQVDQFEILEIAQGPIL